MKGKDLKTKDERMEELIRNKINQFEFPYDSSGWTTLEKQLPRRPFIRTWSGFATMAGIAILFFTLTYLFTEEKEADQIQTTKELSQSDEVNHSSVSDAMAGNQEITSSDQENLQETGLPITSSPSGKADSSVPLSENDPRNTSAIADKPVRPLSAADPVLSEGDAAVQTLPCIPNAMFDLPATSGCAPMVVSPVPAQISDSLFYIWSAGTGQIYTGVMPSIEFTEPGNYSISLTVKCFRSNAESTWTFPQKISVHPRPEADFSWEHHLNKYVFKPVQPAYIHYNWYLADLFFENQLNLEYQFRVSGIYLVRCVAMNDFGCKDSTSHKVEVIIEHPVYIANAFTPDGDGSNDFFGPDPESLLDMEYSLQIFSRDGFMVFETKQIYQKWDGLITGSGEKAPEGLYVWKINTRDKFGNSQQKVGNVSLFRSLKQ
jgi:gliding motility-associated-like protein